MTGPNWEIPKTDHPESEPTNGEIPQMSSDPNANGSQTDRGRYLARGLGYVSSASVGMRAEPEPLGESDLARLAEQTRERAVSGRRETLTAQAARISKSLEHHAAQVQYCERELRRLNRKLAAG